MPLLNSPIPTGSGNSLGCVFLVRRTCASRQTRTGGMRAPAGPTGRQKCCSQWIFHLFIAEISRAANCMAQNDRAGTTRRHGPGEGKVQTTVRTLKPALQRLRSPFIRIQEQTCFNQIRPPLPSLLPSKLEWSHGRASLRNPDFDC